MEAAVQEENQSGKPALIGAAVTGLLVFGAVVFAAFLLIFTALLGEGRHLVGP